MKEKNSVFGLLIILIIVAGLLMIEMARKKPERVSPPPLPPVTRVEKKPVPPPQPQPQPRVVLGKIAVVLDDWGYNLNNMETIKKLTYPLTASILPNLAHSTELSRDLRKKGWEVMLHLPMEPQEKLALERNTITTAMNETQIKDIVQQALASVPECVGVNNHMGSKVTQDSRTMEIILKELKKRNLFFLDSFVIKKSVCARLAGELHVPFARRDVFLDNNPEPDYIKTQIVRLKKLAKSNGYAIGIGHDRRSTLEVLAEQIPAMQQEGYDLVYVSELVK